MTTFRSKAGMTLIEIVLGILILAIGAMAILGAYLSQVVLNEHARNLSLIAQDAHRVLEQIRQQNATGSCAVPSAAIAGGWDAWLAGQSPGKSLPSPSPNTEEEIFVTCQDQDGGAAASDACGPNQTGFSEWRVGAGNTTFDPIRVTVTACWRHRGRTIGECAWSGSALTASDADADGVIESPAMLTTLVTCRQ
ncbi:MAG TPA: type II secretion system protein [bacterium]